MLVSYYLFAIVSKKNYLCTKEKKNSPRPYKLTTINFKPTTHAS